MDYNTDKIIKAGLDMCQPLCPSCNKRIYAHRQTGGFSLNYETCGIGQAQWHFLFCRKCEPHITDARTTKRIKRRLKKNPAAYRFPISKDAIDTSLATLVAGEGEGAWADDDAQWFQQNPGRSFRLRPVYAEEEKTDMAHARHVIVCKAPHCSRIRVAIHTSLPPEEAEVLASEDAYIVQCLAPAFSTELDHTEGSA